MTDRNGIASRPTITTMNNNANIARMSMKCYASDVSKGGTKAAMARIFSAIQSSMCDPSPL